MRYYWYSATQFNLVQQYRFEAGEDYIINEVKVEDTWKQFSETGDSDKPSGRWDDYKLVASGEQLETRQTRKK